MHTNSNFAKNEKTINKINISKINQNTKRVKNKIFNIIHLSRNKLPKNNNKNSISCIEEKEEEYQNEDTNPNINKDLNINKQIINNCQNNHKIKKNLEIKIYEPIVINKNNNYHTTTNTIKNENRKIKEIKVIKRNICIKNNENKINSINNENKDSPKELKKIKVCVLGNKTYIQRKI